MLEWGWRVPFLVAGFTAFIGYYIRRGLPEPAAFVNAKKEEQLADEAEGVEGGATVKADAGLVVGTPTTGKVSAAHAPCMTQRASKRATYQYLRLTW
jgi:hypothetical protein